MKKNKKCNVTLVRYFPNFGKFLERSRSYLFFDFRDFSKDDTTQCSSKQIANFLKEYWGIRDGVGRNLTHNAKGTEDIAKVILDSPFWGKRMEQVNGL